MEQDPVAAARKPIDRIEYCCCELQLIAETELVTKLDDFMRRRSKVAQVLKPSDFIDDPGLFEIAKILFKDKAEEKVAEYRTMLEKETGLHV